MDKDIEYRVVRPYADQRNDGLVQICFTLPIPNAISAQYAAVHLATKMEIGRAHV